MIRIGLTALAIAAGLAVQCPRAGDAPDDNAALPAQPSQRS